MNITRRTLLTGASVAALGAPLAGCFSSSLGDDILLIAREIDALVLKVGAAIAAGIKRTVTLVAADYQALLGFMPTVARIVIQADGWSESLYSTGLLQSVVVKEAGPRPENQQAALKTLASAVAGLHSLAGSALMANAANGSVVQDPQTFFTQVVSTFLIARAATRSQVTAVAAASNGKAPA